MPASGDVPEIGRISRHPHGPFKSSDTGRLVLASLPEMMIEALADFRDAVPADLPALHCA
jgi:hypothetical protein